MITKIKQKKMLFLIIKRYNKVFLLNNNLIKQEGDLEELNNQSQNNKNKKLIKVNKLIFCLHKMKCLNLNKK